MRVANVTLCMQDSKCLDRYYHEVKWWDTTLSMIVYHISAN